MFEPHSTSISKRIISIDKQIRWFVLYPSLCISCELCIFVLPSCQKRPAGEMEEEGDGGGGEGERETGEGEREMEGGGHHHHQAAGTTKNQAAVTTTRNPAAGTTTRNPAPGPGASSSSTSDRPCR